MANNKNTQTCCVFPDIDYHAAFDDLTVQGVPQAMLTFVRERARWEPDLAGIGNLRDLEDDIAGLTCRWSRDRDDDLLQEVFHKIQIWGGEHGRYIYVQGPAFDWAEIGEPYRKLVEACLEDGRTYGSLARKAKGFNSAMKDQGRRLGMSFITKHMHFWSAVLRGDNALPIFDEIMARGLRIRPKWENLETYWQCMEDKALAERVSISALERQLFNYFRTMRRIVTE